MPSRSFMASKKKWYLTEYLETKRKCPINTLKREDFEYHNYFAFAGIGGMSNDSIAKLASASRYAKSGKSIFRAGKLIDLAKGIVRDSPKTYELSDLDIIRWEGYNPLNTYKQRSVYFQYITAKPPTHITKRLISHLEKLLKERRTERKLSYFVQEGNFIEAFKLARRKKERLYVLTREQYIKFYQGIREISKQKAKDCIIGLNIPEYRRTYNFLEAQVFHQLEAEGRIKK